MSEAGESNNLQMVVSERFQQRLVASYEGILEDPSELQRLFQEGLQEFHERLDDAKVYDFCIISSDAEEDIEIAYKIQQCLSNALHIRGCLLRDAIRAGMDIISGYEDVMDRSSKILFLLTKNFSKDNFCQRVQNGAVYQALMEKTKKTEKEKCVPVFLESFQNMKVPLALSGIAGIKFYDIENNRPMLRKTFSYYEFAQRKLQQKLHEKFCKEIMDSKVKDYLMEQKQKAIESAQRSERLLALQQPNSTSGMAVHANTQMEAMIAAALQSVVTAGLPSSDIATISAQLRLAMTSQSSPEPKVFVSGSTGVTVGNHHTINININPTTATEEPSSSSETDEDSDDAH